MFDKLGHMKKFVSMIAAGILLCILVSPFVHDAYSRYEILRRFGPLLTEHDRVALNYWKGDMASFVSFIRARCKQTVGLNAEACEAYGN
jgi:hypothetical protein